VAGTASAVAGRVHHRQDQKYAAQDQAAYEQQAYEEQQAAPVVSDSTAELQQIAQLHAQGILTDEEFAAKKAQILGI